MLIVTVLMMDGQELRVRLPLAVILDLKRRLPVDLGRRYVVVDMSCNVARSVRDGFI